MMNATYSPEDNKLRLYSSTRLDSETYARVKAAGFSWAPKQELFVAPAWSPGREDLLIELCGEIGDEDTSLVERAEERAERFEDYSDKRGRESDQAHKQVQSICDGIPFGQPILVGHHSERHARKDAERIENGMRKAVKLWETSKYWTMRAQGAISHAKYKELPTVRARRIKGLEADKRKQERGKAEAEKWLALWSKEGLTLEQARVLAGYCHLGVAKKEDNSFYWTAYDVLRPDEDRYKACPSMTVEQVQEKARLAYPRLIARCDRWINHISNRLAYEKAMLNEQGASDLLKPKPRPEQLPLCNYRVPEGFIMIPNEYHRGEMLKYEQVEMTKEEYSRINKDYKGTRPVERSHRVRTAYRQGKLITVFLTDSKVHTKPEPVEVNDTRRMVFPQRMTEKKEDPKEAEMQAMKDQIKTGIQVVSAPQLFPTPPEIARAMVSLADIQTGQRILEPSAGTGNLIKAIEATETRTDIVAVELNQGLVQVLQGGNGDKWGIAEIVQGDFLEQNGNLGKFDRIVMNPPFENGADIKHIRHAMTFLKPGGMLVALCANGPRQRDAFRDIAEYWEDLPAGSFKDQGTNVNVAMLSITAKEAAHAPR